MNKGSQSSSGLAFLLKQMGGKAVLQRVRGHALADLGHMGGGMTGARELARRHRVDGILSGKQPALGSKLAAQKVEVDVGEVAPPVHILDDPRLLRMQCQ